MAVRTTADGEVVNGRLRPMANSKHGHDTTAKGNHKQNKTWGSSKFSFGNKLQRESAGRVSFRFTLPKFPVCVKQRCVHAREQPAIALSS